MLKNTGLGCSIVGASYRKAFTKGVQGQTLVNESALDLDLCERTFRRAVSAHGGDVWRRVHASQKRIGTNSDRPLGSTPVRGNGLALYGPPRTRPQSGWSITDRNIFDKRNTLINAKQTSYYEVWRKLLSEAGDESDRAILDWEMQQTLTGGGYDNGEIYATYQTAIKFADNQKNLPELDPQQWEFIVASCHDLREHFVNCGMRLGSLSPAPYGHVRAEQDKDGVIGFPIYEKGNLEFSPKIARAIKSVAEMDLSRYIGTIVEDPDTGYVGKFRNQDAIAVMLDGLTVGMHNCAPLVTIFARTQRHGYKTQDGVLVPKDGKNRAVFVPDAIHGGIGAMVGKAFQQAIQASDVKDFPGLMKPQDRHDAIFQMVKQAAENGFVVLSTDESQYDSTLLNSVMATIVDLVIRPFFKPEWSAWIDATIASLTYKVLVFPDAALYYLEGGKSELSKSRPIRGSILVPCLRGGLISGHQLTATMGSMYGRVTCQKTLAYEMNYTVPSTMQDGFMVGDDNITPVPRAMVDLSSAEGTYGKISEIYGKYGIQVNTSKQIHVVSGDEPLCIFLQTAYHAGLNIKGEGSAARPLASVSFSEYNDRYPMTLQLLGQISVMNNAATSRYSKEAVRMWLDDDPLLTYLFQIHGSEAWRVLIDHAGGVDALLSLPETGAFAFAVDRETIIRGESPPIVAIISDVARTMDTRQDVLASYTKLMTETAV